MKAFFEKGEIRENQAIDNVLVVYYPVDDADSTIIGLNYTETPLLKMFLENRKMKRIWMERPTGTLYPLSQVPPEKYFLPQYAWFDYVRPLNKADIFNWRPKKAGTELKEQKRREPPSRKMTAPAATGQTGSSGNSGLSGDSGNSGDSGDSGSLTPATPAP